MLFGIVYFYMRGRNVFKYSVFNLDYGCFWEKVEGYVEVEERCYIWEGNLFDLGVVKFEVLFIMVRKIIIIMLMIKKIIV